MDVFDDNGNIISNKNVSVKNEESKRVIAGVLALLMGVFAVHKFVLGYTKEGIIQLVISVGSCGILSIIGFIEGIIYLTKSDEEFINTYQNNKKGWF